MLGTTHATNPVQELIREFDGHSKGLSSSCLFQPLPEREFFRADRGSIQQLVVGYNLDLLGSKLDLPARVVDCRFDCSIDQFVRNRRQRFNWEAVDEKRVKRIIFHESGRSLDESGSLQLI